MQYSCIQWSCGEEQCRFVLCVFFYSGKCQPFAGHMLSCLASLAGGPLSLPNQCHCPTVFMSVYKLSAAGLAYCFKQHQPVGWRTPGKYCGSVGLNCPAPNCVTY